MLAMIMGRRIWPSYGPSEGAASMRDASMRDASMRDASMRDAIRVLRSIGLAVAEDAAPLESLPRGDDPPRLEAAAPLEGDQVRVRSVGGSPEVGFAAAIRRRADRRMHTWESPVVDPGADDPRSSGWSAWRSRAMGTSRSRSRTGAGM